MLAEGGGCKEGRDGGDFKATRYTVGVELRSGHVAAHSCPGQYFAGIVC